MAFVAAKAGVSQMTVSLALRDHPSLPEATRRRIKTLAAQLGYRPDPVVSHLMSRLRTSRVASPEVIAWITTHTTKTGWRENAASVAFHVGAERRAQTLGYKLENFWLGAPGMNGHRMSRILDSRGIKGVLIPPLLQPGLAIDLEWSKFAVATCGGFTLLSPSVHRACADYTGSTRLAWRELARRGYRRIGLALSIDYDQRTSGLWTGGLLIEQRNVPLSQRVKPLLTEDWNHHTIWRWFNTQRPDAIISVGNTVYNTLCNEGLSMPKDCGYAHLGQIAEYFSGVDEQRNNIGAAALDLVIEQLNTNQFGPTTVRKTVSINCLWHEGETAPDRTGSVD